MEDESINPNLFIAFDADFIDQVFLAAEGTQCRKEPAVAAKALTYVACGSTFVIESRVFKDVLRSNYR